MASSAPKVGYILNLWHRHPELVGSSFMGILGVVIATGSLWMYYDKDGDRKKYKFTYTVYRPNDPRIADIRKHSNLDD